MAKAWMRHCITIGVSGIETMLNAALKGQFCHGDSVTLRLRRPASQAMETTGRDAPQSMWQPFKALSDRNRHARYIQLRL